MSSGPPAKYGPKRLAALDKEMKALNLLAAGATYSEIARQVGYFDASGARKACDRLLDRQQFETTDRFKRLQMVRYKKLLLGVWVRATAGEHEAFGDAIKALDGMNLIQGVRPLSASMLLNDAQVNGGTRIQVNQFQFHIPDSDDDRARLADHLRGIALLTGGNGEEGPGVSG